MATPYTRTPPLGAPRAGPLPDDEEEGEQVDAAPVGELPPPVRPIPAVQRTRPYVRPTYEPAARLPDDPTERAAASMAKAEAEFEAKQRAVNPFLFSGAVRSLAKEGGRRYMDRAVREGEAAYADQVANDRAAAVAARQQEVENQKAVNAERERILRGTGQKFYTDPFGNIQPVLDPRGRALYSPTAWTRAEHPKDKRPVLEMRDQYGQRQFKNFPLTTTDDPNDMQMYWDVGDGESVPAMSIEEAIKSPDLSVARKARVAQLGKMRGQKRQAVAATAQEVEAVDLERKTEAAKAEMMLRRAEELASKGGDAAEIDKLNSEAFAIQDSLEKNVGELGQRKMLADARHLYTKTLAERDGYLLNQEEIAERLIARGIDPETDPIYQANKKGLAVFERALGVAQKGLQDIEGLRQPVPATPAAPAPEPTLKENLANTGLSVARGATSEGIYAAGEGGARVFSQSPIRRGLESLEDWATEKIQGFPLTDQQKATRQRLRQRAAEKTGSATVDRFARDYADATSKLREDIRRALPVDQKFAESLTGKIAQGAGQLAGTTAAALATGGAGVVGTSIGQIYDEGYQDAIQSGATPEQAHSAAMKYLPAAALDTLADRMVVGKLLKPLVGKMTVGQFVKDVLATGAVEGVTEGAQQAWLNQVASKLEGYDPNRPFDKEVLDSVLVGAVIGGGASTVGTGVRSVQQRGEAPAEGGDATPAETAPVTPPPPEGTPGNAGDRSELQIAEEEFQRRLAASDLTPTERALFERLRAEGEPVAEPPPPTREERQAQLEETFGTVRPERVNPVSAEASAEIFQQEEHAAAITERRIQGLLDELSAGNDAERARLLAFRQRLSTEDFLAALEGVLDYRRNPAGQPDVVAADVQREVDARQNAPINGETPGVTNVGRIIPAELEAQADMRATDEATRVARAMAEAGGNEAYRPDVPEREATLRDEPSQRAAESASALEAGLAEEERLRQSARGGEALREQLSNEPTPAAPAPEPVVATAEVPAGVAEETVQDVPATETKDNWVRGESQRNANGDLFFSTSDEIAGDFGDTRPITESERPKNTLAVEDKNALAAEIGYDGDPLAEPLDTPVGRRFDTLAKAYAKKKGYDSIRYENGTFGEPELHVFRDTEAVGRPPVVTDPSVIARDRRQYDVLQRRLSSLTKKLGADVLASPEYQAAWQASEDIKNRHGGMPPGEVRGGVTPKQALQALVSKLDEGETLQAVAEEIDAMENVPESVRSALEEYKREVQEDFTELGMRGDVEAYSAPLEAAIRKAAGKAKTASVEPSVAEPVESAVDVSPILNAKTEKEMLTTGGKMMREANSRDNMAAIQKAMQQWTAPAQAASTAELRANNAGLDLPPVSSLTAAQKLAELRQGGITTYAGKPIEEANPAQLSNALGKFRRGELTPEGEKPGAASGPLITDRAIEALKKAKIRTDDKAFSGETAIAAAAYNAALDIAILGLRAGRPLEQVIRLAVARYRAVHQAATEDEVSALTQAITTAASEPAPIARKESSRVQESLKDRGLPVAPQEYDVRAQNERVAEAKALIKSQGEVAAEALLQDRNIPADTRVAIGGELLRTKMDAMKKAKPEEAAVLTKDIQRIAEATRSNVSTESGQGVAMHSKIYENLGVRSSMDYVRSIQKDRVRKMGGEKAEQAAQEAADAFNKTKDQAARDAAIERLKKRYTEKPVVKMLNALKGLQRAQELNDLGVLTRDDMIDVAGKALGLPGASGEKLKHIATLVDRVENAPNLAEAEKAQLELTETLANYKGLDRIDLETAQMTLNVLASMNTQSANAGGNALRLVTELASVAAVNPTVARQRALWTGFQDGLPLGWDQAKSIWKTGRGTRDLQDRTIGVSSEVERADYRELYPNLAKPVADALNLKKDVLARVGRFMRAVDALAYYPAREAYARMAATKYFEGTLKGTALEKKVAETLHTTPSAIRSAREQAKNEGYSGISLARRASEIIEARRGLTPEGAKAAEESEAFGAQTTYTNEPEGLAGVIYRAASGIVDKVRIEGVPILKPWMMFLRTPANIFNAAKNYTPAGFYEAAKGKTITKDGERILNEDEINRRYFQATVGSALMASAFLAVAKGLMDITEKGPEDPEKRKQLMAAGWRPYSFRIGKGPYISYRDTPLITALSAVGIVADDYKYNGAQRKDLGEQVASALVEAPLKAAFATSPMTGLAELLDSAVSGKGSGLGRTVAGIPANVLIPGVRLASEIDRYTDPKVYDSNPLQQTVPFLRRQGTPRTDIQGRDVESRPSDRFIGMPTTDRLDRTLTERGLFIPGVGSTIKLGKEEMTDDQKDAYKRLSGQRIRTRLMGMVPLLERLDLEKAQEAIDRVTRDERERAKGIVRRMPAAKP